MVLLILLTLFAAISLTVVFFLENRKKYWSRKGVPYIEMEIPFISKRPSENPRAAFEVMHDDYTAHKKLGHKHLGVFRALRPHYVPLDPDLVRNILAKDFAHFMDRGIYYNEKHDPISAQLFNLEGQRWKNLRAKLTPTFTSGKMKMMFETVVDCGTPMVERLEQQCAAKEAVDIKEILACFTTDVIGSCAFGLDCDSFKCGDGDSAFRAAGKSFFGMNRWRMYRILMIAFFPEVCKAIGVPMFEKSLTNFYFNVVKDTVRYREENAITRNDFMQLLIELKNDVKEGLTIGEIAAQSILFFLAGFETSSTLMHFCFYELTQNPDVQEKLRKEILETLKKHDGNITYESVMQMKYVEQVLEETLRKYPPVPTLLRKCVKDYNVPDTDVVIKAGTKVDIPVYSLHHDPEHYPQPDKFDPERFNEENKAARHQYVYLPFGEGPRICIGLRFGMMQSRIGLALILKNFRVRLHRDTVTPIGISPTAFMMSSKHKVWIELEKL